MQLQVPQTAHSLGYNVKAILTSVCMSIAEVQNSLGYDINYMYSLVPWAPVDSIVCEYTGWSAQEFSDLYLNEYGKVPPYQAASAFAAGLVVIKAIEKTQSLDPIVLIQEMVTSCFPTFYGNMTFDESHYVHFDTLVEQVCFY